MEFEKDKPATAQDIALAGIPKITLQPAHPDIAPESTNTNYTHLNEASFPFEAESTAISTQPDNPASAYPSRHRTAVIVATIVAITFGLGVVGLYSLR